MCLSCSDSNDPLDDHGDYRSLTWGLLCAAAEAANVTPAQALANMVATLAYAGEPEPEPVEDDGGEQAAQLHAELDAQEPVQKSITAVGAVIKAQAEQRFTLTVAYPAVRKDGHGEFAQPMTVEKTAHDYLANKRQIGLYHMEQLVGYGTVVESSIHRGPDWITKAVDGSEQVVHAGDWLLGVIWDAMAWSAIRKGMVNGMSIDGRARKRPVRVLSV